MQNHYATDHLASMAAIDSCATAHMIRDPNSYCHFDDRPCGIWPLSAILHTSRHSDQLMTVAAFLAGLALSL